MAAWKQQLTERKPAPMRPPIWARGGHAQTLLGHFLPSRGPASEGEPVAIDLDHGDKLIAHYYPPRDSSALVYLFHGLGGSTRSDYMARMTRLAVDHGYGVLAVNHRGCGTGRWLAAKPYHSGRAEDLAAAIGFGRRLHPECLHLAVGFSLSGNAMLLLAAGVRGDVLPDLAISVNAPIQLGKSVLDIKRGISRLYDLRFLQKCRRAVRDRVNKGLIPDHFRIPPWCTLHDFDNIYTAPEGGFRDREDYYETCSAQPYLSQIQVPTVAIICGDDPMIDLQAYLEVDRSDFVWLHQEKHGGHMGYLSGVKTPLGDRRWLDYLLDHYIASFLAQVARQDKAHVPLARSGSC